ncbi:neuronal PAS domain-containing protein 4-like [Stegostoma tigrinum]|uniref:neuronal PAS domain-containing protein 4-like n=1 Tax=Stegostoma tigrinum TaxID=3053191 RepID=UPI00286FF063|nr:neuronal PAS domain-containing protein 4-like [Stegostoma tigrinum]
MTVGSGGRRWRTEGSGETMAGARSPCDPGAQQNGSHGNQLTRRSRSTKGASKARRDLINCEIRSLRNLLPLTEEEKQSLSYLQTMALVNIYLHKALYSLGGRDEPGSSPGPGPGLDFLPALPGFLITITPRGRILQLSDNVHQFLGFSMVDVLSHGDSFYDMLDGRDVEHVQNSLQSPAAPNTGRSFLCHVRCSKATRLRGDGLLLVLVTGQYSAAQRGHWPPTAGPVFRGLCAPVQWSALPRELGNCAGMFHSQHCAELKLTAISHSVVYFLGYDHQDLQGTSWYSLLHPADIMLCRSQHQHLLLRQRQCIYAEGGFRMSQLSVPLTSPFFTLSGVLGCQLPLPISVPYKLAPPHG